MAVLAVAAVGAGIGSAIGGTFLGVSAAAWGWTIGGIVGNLLFPTKLPDAQGPRLGDLSVQDSSYGKPVARYEGTVRGAGNLIWSTEKRERAHTEEVGGKGGPTQEVTTYTYDVDCAFLLGEGPIQGVRKIWMNGKLVYSSDAAASAATLIASSEFSESVAIYLGDETQLPDPTIEADKGVGNVPAYRGYAYVVFKTLQLAEFGNAIPNVTFEIVASGTTVGLRKIASVTGGPDISESPDYVRFDAGVLQASRISSAWLTGQPIGSFPSGKTWTFDADGAHLGVEAFTYPTGYGVGGTTYAWFQGYVGDSALYINKTSGTPNVWYVVLGGGTLASHTSNDAARVEAVVIDHDRDLLMLFRRSSSGAKYYEEIDGSGTVLATYSHTVDFYPGAPSVDVTQPVFNGGTQALAIEGDYLWFKPGITASSAMYLYKRGGSGDYSSQGNVSNSAFANNFAMVARHGVAYLFGRDQIDIFTRIQGLSLSPPTLADVVTRRCTRAGLSASDIDVTGLAGITVDGYVMANVTSARQEIEPLMKAYLFDAVESDDKIKFVKRGGAAVMTIAEDDLGAHEFGSSRPDPLPIHRLNEDELPASIVLQYINAAADYQPGAQPSRRLVTTSNAHISEEVAIVLSDAQAATVADALMFDAWTVRNQYQVQLSRKYVKLEPADVITVSKGGATHTLRLTRREESGGLLKFEAVAEDAAVYSLTTQAAAAPVPPSTVALDGPTRVELLDIPLLRDQDDEAGFYAPLAGYLDTWPGAALYKSSDGGGSYSAVGSVSQSATFGVADTVLGNFYGGNVFDELNTVTVTMARGALTNATEAQVLAGGNAMLVGSEIIQFKTAALISGRQYRLSGLLRGRKGTEQYMGTHAAGERVVLLGTAGMLNVACASGEIGVARLYKAVTFGAALEGAATKALTLQAVRLKPLAPVHIGAGLNGGGDILLQAVRQARKETAWRDYVDVALDETTEAYEVEIWDDTFASLKRTLTGLTTPSATYSAANQTTDFGNPPARIGVRWYQLSSVVGRGAAGQAVLSVRGDARFLHHCNNSGTDASGYGNSLILQGSAAYSTTLVKFGSHSLRTPGTSGNYARIAHNAGLVVGSSDFCLELWTAPDAAATTDHGVIVKMGGGADPYLGIVMTPTGGTGSKTEFYARVAASGGTKILHTGNDSAIIGSMQHLALSREGGTLRLFHNGALVASDTVSGSVSDSGADWTLGIFNPTYGKFYAGYSDEIRLTIGKAVYTAAFTPPNQEY